MYLTRAHSHGKGVPATLSEFMQGTYAQKATNDIPPLKRVCERF